MDYQEALASLERGQKQAGMTVKFVPGKTTGGWLSDETWVNLAPVFNASPAQADEKPSIQDMRDRMMGAPGSKKNIAKHSLQIENLVIDGVATRRYRPRWRGRCCQRCCTFTAAPITAGAWLELRCSAGHWPILPSAK